MVEPVESAMNGPHLAVYTSDRSRGLWKTWKEWYPRFSSSVRCRKEGPAIIYQDGSVWWWSCK